MTMISSTDQRKDNSESKKLSSSIKTEAVAQEKLEQATVLLKRLTQGTPPGRSSCCCSVCDAKRFLNEIV